MRAGSVALPQTAARWAKRQCDERESKYKTSVTPTARAPLPIVAHAKAQGPSQP